MYACDEGEVYVPEIQSSTSFRHRLCNPDGVRERENCVGVQNAFSQPIETRSAKRGGIEQARKRGVGACRRVHRQSIRSLLFQAVEGLSLYGAVDVQHRATFDIGRIVIRFSMRSTSSSNFICHLPLRNNSY